jgi:hypothetical protein
MTSLTVRRLIGVYHADGTVLGELRYVLGRTFGRAHCALCDITHGAFTAKSEWNECRTTLGVPFDTYHRNDQPDALREAIGTTPVVAAEFDDGSIVALLHGDDLDACHGSPHELMRRVRAALDALQCS